MKCKDLLQFARITMLLKSAPNFWYRSTNLTEINKHEVWWVYRKTFRYWNKFASNVISPMNCHFCSANSGVTEKVNFRFRRLEETQNFELCELKSRKHHGKKRNYSPLRKKKICVFDVRLIFFNRSIFIRLTFVKYLATVQS